MSIQNPVFSILTNDFIHVNICMHTLESIVRNLDSCCGQTTMDIGHLFPGFPIASKAPPQTICAGARCRLCPRSVYPERPQKMESPPCPHFPHISKQLEPSISYQNLLFCRTVINRWFFPSGFHNYPASLLRRTVVALRFHGRERGLRKFTAGFGNQ